MRRYTFAMTRAFAILLSYFGSALPLAVFLLFFAFFDNELPDAVGAIGMILFVIAALTIRVYFAAWYARDKGRSGALGLMSLFGLLGWLFLVLMEDRKSFALS